MPDLPAATPPKPGYPRPRLVHRMIAVIAVALFIALLAFGLFSKATNRSVDESLAKGTAPPAPEFNDEVLEAGMLPSALDQAVRPALVDGELSLYELRGTPFVLNFWASWCVPCREEAPVLRAGWRRFGPEGVLFLGLNMQDLTGDARAFISQYRLDYPTVREPSNDTAGAYGVTGIPETFFVSARGRIVGHVIGVVDEAQLVEGVVAAKRGQIVGTEEGGSIRPQR